MTVAPNESPRRYTLQEYLRLEEADPSKNEFHDGEILAMSGTSPEHALIAMNALATIHAALKGKPCRVYSNDLKIAIGRTARVFYPDGSIICGAIEGHPDDPQKRHLVTNPRVVIEVLSPTTENYNRSEKFRYYRMLDSLQEYVLISQSAPIVETFFRQSDGVWTIGPTSTGLGARAAFRSVEIEIALSEIFAGVEFPPPALPPDPREREHL